VTGNLHGQAGQDQLGSGNLPYIIFIRPGPSHSLDDVLPHAMALGSRFRGEYWTHGGYNADMPTGNLRLRVLQSRGERNLPSYVDFWRVAMQRADDLRHDALKETVVVSYDPMKTGLLASRVATRIGALLVCEVNGTFGDPAIFSDAGSAVGRRLRSLQTRLLGAYVLRRADGVKLLFDHQLAGFAKPGKRAMIRRFTDIAHIDRFYEGPEEPIVLMAGYPYRLKGTDILFKAFASIADAFPEWKLVLIGHQLAEGMQRDKLAHPRVQVLPGMRQIELARWISRCAIVAQPSRTEAMGRVLVEAAAAGKCRIASDVNGIPTVIDNGNDGLLVPGEDTHALASGLATLMSDANLRRRLGSNARVRALREFSVEAYLDHYSEFLAALLRHCRKDLT
jgi:glycosyltransferase involved in cell wall biosynthesis